MRRYSGSMTRNPRYSYRNQYGTMMFSDSMVTNHSQTLKLSRNPSSARNEIHRYWTNVKMTMTSA